jgi:hypothetical protein
MNDDNVLAGILRHVQEVMGSQAAADELASRLVQEVFQVNPGGAQDILLPAVTAYVRQQLQERTEVLRLEKRVFSGERDAGYVNPAEDGMRKLLRDTCYVPGHGMVPWGDMTAEFHELRIGYLEARKRAFAAGIDDTVRRHRAAIGILKESGCRTLNEYEETRAAARA